MSFTTALLMPLVLLLPAAGSVEPSQDVPDAVASPEQEAAVDERGVPRSPRVTSPEVRQTVFQSWPLMFVAQGFRPESAFQVRIERRMTIRVIPRSSPVRPDAFVGVPDQPIGPRFIERRIGDCIPVERISGVQANGGKNLLIFLSDRRIVSAYLERSCRARDFYSGFYLSRSDDGKLCVDRDALQSRSGANCKLTRMRQLVEIGG